MGIIILFFDPSQLGNHSADVNETWNLQLLPKDHPPYRTVFRSDDMGCLGKKLVATARFLSLSFFGFLSMRTGRTGGPILTINISYDVFPCKDVPFGGSVDMSPHLGGQIHKKM